MFVILITASYTFTRLFLLFLTLVYFTYSVRWGTLFFFKSPPINGLCNYFCFLIISPNSVEFSNLTKFVSESKEDVSSTSVQVTVKKGVKRKADTTTPLSSDQVCDQFSSDQDYFRQLVTFQIY